MPKCSCPAWFNDAYPCKHFFVIFIKENLTWSAFGSSYGSSPYFSLDLFSDENKYTNDIFLQNNLVVHETPLSVTSQTEPIVQKALSIKVNSSLDETKVDCGHHNLAACCELLNEITKLTCLCTSQKDIDLLFEELY